MLGHWTPSTNRHTDELGKAKVERGSHGAMYSTTFANRMNHELVHRHAQSQMRSGATFSSSRKINFHWYCSLYGRQVLYQQMVSAFVKQCFTMDKSNKHSKKKKICAVVALRDKIYVVYDTVTSVVKNAN